MPLPSFLLSTAYCLLSTLPLLSTVCCLLSTNAPWPGWRGPEGTGVIPGQDLPVRWSATENVRWKVPLQGAGVSGPVVWGDRIFLTTSDGRLNDRLHVTCYHRDDGRTLWHTRLFGSAPTDLFPPGGMAVPTPATDGERLYALFGTGDLICLDFDGRPVWVRSLAEEYGPFRNRWGMGASPILVGGLLVVQVDHSSQSYLLGIDARTGANRWRTPRDAAVNWTSPVAVTVQGRTQLVAVGTYQVKGYDAETGAELWTVQGMQMQCIPSPAVQGETVVAVSGRRGNALAIRLDGQRGDLTNTHVLWKTTRGTPYIPSPVVYEGRYYMVDDDGMASCLDAATGARVWQERLGGKYQASVLAGAGKVYFTSLDGVVTVVRAGPTFTVLAKNKLDERLTATPAFSQGQVFLRGEKYLYCIQEPAGKEAGQK